MATLQTKPIKSNLSTIEAELVVAEKAVKSSLENLKKICDNLPDIGLGNYLYALLSESKDHTDYIEFQFSNLSKFAVHGEDILSMAENYVDPALLSSAKFIRNNQARFKSSQIKQIGKAYGNWKTAVGKLSGIKHSFAMETAKPETPQGSCFHPTYGLSEVYENSSEDVADTQSLHGQIVDNGKVIDCILTLQDAEDSTYYCDYLSDTVVLESDGTITYLGENIGNLVSDALV